MAFFKFVMASFLLAHGILLSSMQIIFNPSIKFQEKYNIVNLNGMDGGIERHVKKGRQRKKPIKQKPIFCDRLKSKMNEDLNKKYQLIDYGPWINEYFAVEKIDSNLGSNDNELSSENQIRFSCRLREQKTKINYCEPHNHKYLLKKRYKKQKSDIDTLKEKVKESFVKYGLAETWKSFIKCVSCDKLCQWLGELEENIKNFECPDAMWETCCPQGPEEISLGALFSPSLQILQNEIQTLGDQSLNLENQFGAKKIVDDENRNDEEVLSRSNLTSPHSIVDFDRWDREQRLYFLDIMEK